MRLLIATFAVFVLLSGCAAVPELRARGEPDSYAGKLRRAAELDGPSGSGQRVASVQAMVGDVEGR